MLSTYRRFVMFFSIVMATPFLQAAKVSIKRPVASPAVSVAFSSEAQSQQSVAPTWEQQEQVTTSVVQ